MKESQNITSGEILLEEFMKPLGLSQYALAKELAVSPMRISEIVRGKRAITADTALRLGIYFGTGPDYWLRIQSECDLRKARRQAGNKIARKVKPRVVAA
jgi:addiction module HigA family antidote